jgi:uncharacterized protein YlxW (UPF0749 family)
MTTDPASQMVRWVQEGERLFAQVLQGLHRAELLARENQRLREEIQTIREEVEGLKAERLEAAETLKTFAEHVTRVATLALERLGRRGAPGSG